jgi:hypothetical protein
LDKVGVVFNNNGGISQFWKGAIHLIKLTYGT